MLSSLIRMSPLPGVCRTPVPTATAFAATITNVAIHAAASRCWSRTTRPTSAAKTGFTLMKTPKKCGGTRRSVSRSDKNGTAEERIPAARVLLAGVDELVGEAATGHTRLRVGHAWSAFGRRTTEFQRVWREREPGVELRLIRHDTPTAGLAEGLCDLAVVRALVDLGRWSHALVGHEPRYVALAADDPWARRRGIRLAEISARTLVVDRRTGTTGPELWPREDRPAVEYTHDIDDWLAAIATGGRVGVTPQSTSAQYRRDGIVYRPLRDAAPVPVHLLWRRHDPHPATHAAVALAMELYRDDGRTRDGSRPRRP